jgi:hypothetical protein
MPQRNIWDDVSGKSIPRHWMGAWLNYRKLASLEQLPNSDYRAQFAGLYPMDYGFTFSLATQQTGDQRTTIMKNWILYGAVCSASLDSRDFNAGNSFKAQIYIGKYKQGVAFSDRPMRGDDQFGGFTGGMFVRWFKTPLWIPPNTPLLIRAQNLNTTGETNQVEIVLQGCGE